MRSTSKFDSLDFFLIFFNFITIKLLIFFLTAVYIQKDFHSARTSEIFVRSSCFCFPIWIIYTCLYPSGIFLPLRTKVRVPFFFHFGNSVIIVFTKVKYHVFYIYKNECVSVCRLVLNHKSNHREILGNH